MSAVTSPEMNGGTLPSLVQEFRLWIRAEFHTVNSWDSHSIVTLWVLSPLHPAAKTIEL